MYVDMHVCMCHRIDCSRLMYKVSPVLVMFSGKTLHYSIPMMSSVMSLMTSPVLPKAIKAAALSSMIYNMARFQTVYIGLLVDYALILR